VDDNGGHMKKKFVVHFHPEQNGHAPGKTEINAESIHQSRCGNILFKTDGKIVAIVDRSTFKFIKEEK
jgi:hypothetical protein